MSKWVIDLSIDPEKDYGVEYIKERVREYAQAIDSLPQGYDSYEIKLSDTSSVEGTYDEIQQNLVLYADLQTKRLSRKEESVNVNIEQNLQVARKTIADGLARFKPQMSEEDREIAAQKLARGVHAEYDGLVAVPLALYDTSQGVAIPMAKEYVFDERVRNAFEETFLKEFYDNFEYLKRSGDYYVNDKYGFRFQNMQFVKPSQFLQTAAPLNYNYQESLENIEDLSESIKDKGFIYDNSPSLTSYYKGIVNAHEGRHRNTAVAMLSKEEDVNYLIPLRFEHNRTLSVGEAIPNMSEIVDTYVNEHIVNLGILPEHQHDRAFELYTKYKNKIIRRPLPNIDDYDKLEDYNKALDDHRLFGYNERIFNRLISKLIPKVDKKTRHITELDLKYPTPYNAVDRVRDLIDQTNERLKDLDEIGYALQYQFPQYTHEDVTEKLKIDRSLMRIRETDMTEFFLDGYKYDEDTEVLTLPDGMTIDTSDDDNFILTLPEKPDIISSAFMLPQRIIDAVRDSGIEIDDDKIKIEVRNPYEKEIDEQSNDIVEKYRKDARLFTLAKDMMTDDDYNPTFDYDFFEEFYDETMKDMEESGQKPEDRTREEQQKAQVLDDLLTQSVEGGTLEIDLGFIMEREGVNELDDNVKEIINSYIKEYVIQTFYKMYD